VKNGILMTAPEAETLTRLSARKIFRPANRTLCGRDLYPTDRSLRFQLGRNRTVVREGVGRQVVFELVGFGATWALAVESANRAMGVRKVVSMLPRITAIAAAILLIFVFMPAVGAAGMDGEPSPVQLGASAAAFSEGMGLIGQIGPMVAEATPSMPDSSSNVAIMWVLGAIIGLIILLGAVASSVIAVFSIIEKIRGTSKVEATTKRSDDGPGRVEFDLHMATMREDMIELKTGQQTVLTELKAFGGDQYKARGRMHRKVNTLENAMHFWAGKLAGTGDPDAKRLVNILDASKAEEGDS